ncbi:MAG: MBL fold metallo-hydrolase, partial [Gammaproteobacteria bacterium]|nr:MBL fold metallo-hydrolase [Gammaproteobacteria bacterium]
VKDRLGGRLAISGGVVQVQRHFAGVFNPGDGFAADGSDFDHLFSDGERFALGGIEASVLHTPGHTSACACYVIGDAVFVGDTLLMPDAGCGRCDFPGGSAAVLFDSLKRVLALDPATRVFVGHDSGASGKRAVAWETTVAEQRSGNIYCGDGVSRSEFIARREARDAELSTPRLMLPAMQVNIRAGRLPAPESNGSRYLKIPLNVLKS